jgi:preprotein translocase subunit SecD
MRPVIQLVDAHARTWRVLRSTCHWSETAIADCMASMHGTDRVTIRDGSRMYVLGPVVLDGSGVASAKAIDAAAGGDGFPVDLQLTSTATQDLAAATEQASAARAPWNEIAAVLNGAVVMAPTVQGAITTGVIQLSGGFTQGEARSIASELNGAG